MAIGGFIVLLKDYAGAPETGLFPAFSHSLFFNILLPPVILDSAFTLYNAEFFSNLPDVVTFAVVGTLLNIFPIGIVLSLRSINLRQVYSVYKVSRYMDCQNWESLDLNGKRRNI